MEDEGWQPASHRHPSSSKYVTCQPPQLPNLFLQIRAGMDRGMGRWMVGRVSDGWMDKWVDGWKEEQTEQMNK